jgi:predicted RNA binding protein YcfA (HicA-like mRNA interferase family)
VVRTSFTAREVATALQRHGFVPVDRTGSHLKLRYEHPTTDEVRVVSIPMHGSSDLPVGTLRAIADQSGAEDFHAWCAWVDRNC